MIMNQFRSLLPLQISRLTTSLGAFLIPKFIFHSQELVYKPTLTSNSSKFQSRRLHQTIWQKIQRLVWGILLMLQAQGVSWANQRGGGPHRGGPYKIQGVDRLVRPYVEIIAENNDFLSVENPPRWTSVPSFEREGPTQTQVGLATGVQLVCR